MLKMSNQGSSLEEAKKINFLEIEKERQKNGEFETVGEFSCDEPTKDNKTTTDEVPTVDMVLSSIDARDPLVELPYSAMALSKMIFKTEEYSPGDTGNAQRFFELFGNKFKYIASLKSWYLYNGKHWEIAKEGEVQTAMLATAEAMKDEIQLATARTRGTEENSPQRRHLKNLTVRYWRLGDAKNLLSAIKAAEMMPEFKFRYDELNSEKTAYLFNCASGTINLKTGDLQEFNIKDNITLTSKYHIADNDDCPKFKSFLNDVTLNDPDLVYYIQKIFGSAMIGERRKSQEFYLLLGLEAQNGKSTLMGIMAKAFGSYLVNSSAYTWIQKKNYDSAKASPDVAKLAGARLVFAPELPKGEQFNENLIKSWTGGDVLNARHLNENNFEFSPIGALILSSNHKLKIGAEDNSMWRRNKAIPFLAKFQGAGDNQQLVEELAEELPQILRWLVNGCLAYQKELLKFVPDSVQKCIQSYRESGDMVDQFIKDVCIVSTDPKDYTATTSLFEAYQKWTIAQNHKFSMIRKNFVDNLKRLGFHEGEKTKFQNRSVILKLTIGNLDF